MFHKHRGSIRPDRKEGALTKRKLSAAACKNIESQDSDGIDKQHRDLERHEVRRRQTEREREIGKRVWMTFDEEFRISCRLQRLSMSSGELSSCYTRSTTFRPRRPSGLNRSTKMISASAIGNFSSLPAPGT